MDTELTNTLTLSLLEEAIAYHRWVFEKIRPYLRGNILEVGCGIGNLTGFLLNHGEVIVSDINEGYLQMVENKYRNHPNLKGTHLWNIEQKPVQNFDTRIDTILCSNVLEHVKKDDAALNIFFQLLPEGGRLIILAPALKGLYNVLDKELGHFRRYSRSELTQKLTRNGFRICSLKYFNFFGIFGWFVNGTFFSSLLLPASQFVIFNNMVPFFIWMEKMIPTLVGQSLIVVRERGQRGMTMKHSGIIPVYKEASTILEVVKRVQETPYDKEIIVVDDCSNDGTYEILKRIQGDAVIVLSHKFNQGKGASIRTAMTRITGDFVIIQDADLEYNPSEYPRLLTPLLEGKADVVYGSRFLGGTHRVLFFWHALGNRIITILSNILTDLNLSDMETGYKAFRSEILKKIQIKSNRFGFEPEVTAKIAKMSCRIYEIPISYWGRDYTEGKKISWKDGLAAIYWIVRYNFFK